MNKIIKFGAQWCNPCQRLKPVLAKVLSTNTNIEYLDIDIDEDTSDLVKNYQIRSVPTMIFIKDEEVVGTESGFRSEKDLLELISKYFNS